MKLRNLLITLGLTLTVGAGVAVGLNVPQKEEPKAVEADGTIDIYFSRPKSGYDDAWASYTPNIYYSSLSWPGVAMAYSYTNGAGESVYKASIPDGTSMIIFNSAKQGQYIDQTIDIKTNISNNKGFYLTGGSWGSRTVGTWNVEFYTLAFNANGGTGTMESQKAVRDIDWGVPSNAFTRVGFNFTGWNTRADGSGTSYSAGGTISKNTQASGSTLTLYAQWEHRTGRYIVGKFGSCNWGIDGAIYLVPQNNQYEGIANFEFGDVFKIAYYNGTELSSYFGYSWILESCGAYQYFSGSGDSDITCNARGTYSFYFRDMEYASGKKISIETSGALTAEHLTVKLMNFAESAGHCGDADRFPAMKTIFLGLTSAEKTIFQGYASSSTDQFKNAYDRYTAWARALGEKPWEEGKVSHALQLSIFNDSSTSSSIIIIAIIASLSILSVGAYFFFKKSKKSEE